MPLPTESRNVLQVLRWTALSEGVSWLVLLFIARPLKYGAGIPEAVFIVGMIHGILFMALVGALCWAKVKSPLTWPLGWLIFFASLVPFGAFWADLKLRAFMRTRLTDTQTDAPAPVMESV
ncbi:MAG: DUF3817 domain-containing protein [Opitutales bacterium]